MALNRYADELCAVWAPARANATLGVPTREQQSRQNRKPPYLLTGRAPDSSERRLSRQAGCPARNVPTP